VPPPLLSLSDCDLEVVYSIIFPSMSARIFLKYTKRGRQLAPWVEQASHIQRLRISSPGASPRLGALCCRSFPSLPLALCPISRQATFQ